MTQSWTEQVLDIITPLFPDLDQGLLTRELERAQHAEEIDLACDKSKFWHLRLSYSPTGSHLFLDDQYPETFATPAKIRSANQALRALPISLHATS